MYRTFTISSAYAGLAGVMTALWLDLVKPDENEFTGNYSLTVSIAFLAIIIIGGLGSVPGAVIGAIVVYGLQQFFLLGANQFGWFADAQFGGLSAVILAAFIYGLAMVLVVLVRARWSGRDRPASLARVHHPTREERR